MWTAITGATSAELRGNCMQQHFLPIAREILARDDTVHSAGFLVGQYWADEADDAVHAEILPFPVRDPRWPPEQPVDMEAVYVRLNRVFGAADGYFAFTAKLPNLDSNGSQITAFAAFCTEGCHQDMRVDESHSLYALARRGQDGVELQVVGKMLRPEWEDRFDVGFDAEPTHDGPSGDGSSHDAPPARPRGGGLLGLLRRLFGR